MEPRDLGNFPLNRPAQGASVSRVAEGIDSSDRPLVILPCYNEAASLPEVVSRVLAAVPAAHVLVVEDASTDGTGQIADRLAAEDGRISVPHRPRKLGLGSAYIAGFERALADGYPRIVEMDADGSHLPEQLPELLAASRHAGLVIGARWVPGGRIVGWPRYRRLISRTGTRVARTALRSKLRDMTSGYRVIDASWLSRIDLGAVAAQGYGFQVEIAWTLERLGCPIAEVPITFVERAAGRSKMTPAIVAEALWLVLRWGWRLRFGRDRLPAASTEETATRPRAR